MILEKLPEKFKGLYWFYKNDTKSKMERGFSPEEAFWNHFAVISSSLVWDNKADTQVKLSEVYRLYLSIYCENINPEMKVEDEPIFLDMLKERYCQFNQIMDRGPFRLKNETTNEFAYNRFYLELGWFLLGKDANIIRLTKAALSVVMVINSLADTPIPLKLMRDV